MTRCGIWRPISCITITTIFRDTIPRGYQITSPADPLPFSNILTFQIITIYYSHKSPTHETTWYLQSIHKWMPHTPSGMLPWSLFNLPSRLILSCLSWVSRTYDWPIIRLFMGRCLTPFIFKDDSSSRQKTRFSVIMKILWDLLNDPWQIISHFPDSSRKTGGSLRVTCSTFIVNLCLSRNLLSKMEDYSDI